MEQAIIGGYLNLLHNTTTEWNHVWGGRNWVDEEFYTPQLISTSGKIKNLFVELNDSPGSGKSYAFAIRINGSGAGCPTTTVANGATSNSDTSTERIVSAGDSIEIEVNPSGTPTTRYATWSIMFEGDNPNESIILGGSGSNMDKTSISYSTISSASGWGAQEDIYRQVCPTDGIITNLFVELNRDPGSGEDAYRFTVRLNGATVGESPIVTITNPDTTGNDTAHNLVVTGGDILTLMSEPLNTPSEWCTAKFGMTFVADTDGESLVLGSYDGNLDVLATKYNKLNNSSNDSWWATEDSLMYQLAQACVLKKLYVLLGGSPGSGNKYTFTVRLEGASPDGGLVVEIADGATAGNDVSNDITVSDGQTVNLMCVPDSTPTARTSYWGLVSYIAPPIAPPTNVVATENQSGKVVITWAASDGANQYQVKRDGTPLGWLGDVETYDDSAADAPLITAGASVAGDGASTAHVSLSLDGTSVANGTTHTYVVEARLDGGASSGDSASDTGYRLASAITYQWQRSDGDSDANYNTNLGTASTYDDTGAPAPTITAGSATATDGLTAYVTLSLAGESANVGAGRYYQCVLVSTDASNTPATASANRGHRGVGSLVYKWQVSDADSDTNYNTDITGGSTDPFNYEVTHIDGRYYRCYLTATGASPATSAVDRGWRKPLEVTDGDLIGIAIIRKT